MLFTTINVFQHSDIIAANFPGMIVNKTNVLHWKIEASINENMACGI